MRLLLYSHFFAPSVGGVESIVLDLAKGLTEYHSATGEPEFDITLITQTLSGDFRDAQLPFHVIRQPSSGELRRLIRHADVVHVAGAAIPPVVWALTAGKPVVVEHHGFQTICPTGQLFQEPENIPCPGHFMAKHHSYCLRCSQEPRRLASFRLWLLTFLRRFLCQRVAVNIMPTDWLATQLRLPRAETVPHGLPASPPLVRLEGSGAVPLLVFLGRLVSTKGVRLLLDAARILKKEDRPFELLIAGDGPERTSLEGYAAELGLGEQVRFLGRLSQSQLAATLACVDILVAPSLGGEVFGMVVAESMLRGLAVVASDLGSFVEVLGDCGKTFKTGDALDLANCLAQLLDDPAARQSMGLAARQRVIDLFSLRRMMEEHARIYRSLATEKVR